VVFPGHFSHHILSRRRRRNLFFRTSSLVDYQKLGDMWRSQGSVMVVCVDLLHVTTGTRLVASAFVQWAAAGIFRTVLRGCYRFAVALRQLRHLAARIGILLHCIWVWIHGCKVNSPVLPELQSLQALNPDAMILSREDLTYVEILTCHCIHAKLLIVQICRGYKVYGKTRNIKYSIIFP